ncbi:hypothetical protein K788_0003282 [Paraburkholderia caribensis MBA4]|uniref:Uncharacterized protein n=1 Tax=Paraburkholderia caribensis MBA4 TaxID=1323664 RepID=A0A0P0RCT8_9BURK|nr:hypothetical protein [Paraburkholderia caribensis]ALL66131.1 hypothetical protein K788_0003282 [Paraburkholderia caribensis MBA4]
MDKNKNVPVAASNSAQLPETELNIEIGAMDLCFSGTRAALVAEGLIPDGFEWPEGRKSAWWKSEKQEFQLWRIRPPGHKGTLRTWQTCDWWHVRVRLLNGPSWEDLLIQQKVAEIARLKWQFSAAGARATHDMIRRMDAAAADGEFQAFKALLPGLSGKPKGRSAKAAAQS